MAKNKTLTKSKSTLEKRGDLQVKTPDFHLARWFDRYRKNSRAIRVNFRKLVPQLKSGDRATHYLHPYPAKLLPHIAYFFAQSNLLSRRGSLIVDPFGGSGTVALEALLAGRNAILTDANPFARMIAKAKVRPLSGRALDLAIGRVRARIARGLMAPVPDVVNLRHWYSHSTVNSLRAILYAVQRERSVHVRNFLLLCFSIVARKVSRADPRLSVPVRLRIEEPIRSRSRAEIVSLLFDTISLNRSRLEELRRLIPKGVAGRVLGEDARRLTSYSPLDRRKARLILTSPPYGGAQKYIRASSLSLGWLGLAPSQGLRRLEDKTIGREHFPKKLWSGDQASTSIRQIDRVLARIGRKNQLRACIAATYMTEMRDACKEMVKVLRPQGHLVIVVGNNQVCGREFLTSVYLVTILRQLGMKLRARLIDDIRSRGLMTKRNKTASVITREWVLIFQKS